MADTAQPEPGATTQPRLTKLTVNITSKSVAALDAGSGIEGITKTEAVNRALQLYAFIATHLAAGDQLLLRPRHSDALERVHII
jgi:hypothetical protein